MALLKTLGLIGLIGIIGNVYNRSSGVAAEVEGSITGYKKEQKHLNEKLGIIPTIITLEEQERIARERANVIRVPRNMPKPERKELSASSKPVLETPQHPNFSSHVYFIGSPKFYSSKPRLEGSYVPISKNYRKIEGKNYLDAFYIAKEDNLESLLANFNSEQKEEIVAEVALLGKYYLPKNKRGEVAKWFDKQYELPKKGSKVTEEIVQEAEEMYMAELEEEYGADEVEAFRKKEYVTTLPQHKDILEKLRMNPNLKRTARELTFHERLEIHIYNKKFKISAEKIAEHYNLKSANTVYSVNKGMKERLTNNFGEAYNLFGDENIANVGLEEYDNEFENNMYHPLATIISMQEYREFKSSAITNPNPCIAIQKYCPQNVAPTEQYIN